MLPQAEKARAFNTQTYLDGASGVAMSLLAEDLGHKEDGLYNCGPRPAPRANARRSSMAEAPSSPLGPRERGEEKEKD